MRRIKELFLLHSPHSFIFICLSLERRREQRREQRRVQICESKGECRFVRAKESLEERAKRSLEERTKATIYLKFQELKR
jgi:hypothetical protein